MRHWLVYPLVAFLALQGAPVSALEVGEQTIVIEAVPGGVICDTIEQAQQAISRLDRGSKRAPEGCGNLALPGLAFFEAISKYETDRAVYMMLKVVFLPPLRLGVQFTWQVYSIKPEKPGSPV